MAGLIRIAEVSDKVIKINEPQNKLDAGILDLFHFILLRPRKIIVQLIQPNAVSFEDKLKAFMSDSESRQADVRHATDRKNGSRRRR